MGIVNYEGHLTYYVMGKYPLSIHEEDMDTASTGAGSRGFFYYLQKKPLDLDKNARCFDLMLDQAVASGLPNPLRVVEFFGGIGSFATVVQERLRPREHFIWDLDPFCARHLKRAFEKRSGVTVTEGDAYAQAPLAVTPDTLLVADFNTFSVMYMTKERPEATALGAALAAHPRWVVFTDSAVNKFHLNRVPYERVFGREIRSMEEYGAALSEYLSQRWGYRIISSAGHRNATYYLAEAGKSVPFQTLKL